MDPRVRYLLALLAVFAVIFVAAWYRLGRPQSDDDRAPPTATHIGIGFITNFFDTLGIGSYAPTTALFRLFKLVPDERIPGTLTLGHYIPALAQTYIFTTTVDVEFATLALMIASAVVGAWLGAGTVAGWSRRKVQIGMGIALVVAAGLFTMTNLGIVASGGDAVGLQGTRLVVAMAGNFVLGILMTLGIGLYGPCLIMISLLGMNPRAGFPIMMASCTFLMVGAAIRFLKAGAYRQRAALGLTIGGIPAVLIAALIVKSLPLAQIRWLVTFVVLYTAVTMLRSAWLERTPGESAA